MELLASLKHAILRTFGRRQSASETRTFPPENAQSLSVGNSDIDRRGSFATSDIPEGQFIRRMSGEVLNFEEVNRRILSDQLSPDDPLQIDNDLYIDLDAQSLAINHSCSPNTGIRGQNELIAIRDIRAGEEVTFDYSTTVSSDVAAEDWSMACQCQSENCRQTIGNVLTVPEELLERYMRLNMLPQYIQAELSKSSHR
ncbi:SET domain-containing protein [Ruegeria sp. MALMAid1280]|uniref:SET domain-containing protein n=1 Tax=Ruegeria sp. MALMAid1280 TaxID=3411634 RepID=UPI003BA06310